MCRGKRSVLGGDVVSVPIFCWEKEELSPKTDGELVVLVLVGMRKPGKASTSTDKTLPMSNGFVPMPCMLLLTLCV